MMRNCLAGAVIMMLVMSSIASSAGPCSPEIASMQARLDAKAATGPTAPESQNALRHRQPTPQSLAAAERAVGELSAEKGKIIVVAMMPARGADHAGDLEACERALDEIRRAISP